MRRIGLPRLPDRCWAELIDGAGGPRRTSEAGDRVLTVGSAPQCRTAPSCAG